MENQINRDKKLPKADKKDSVFFILFYLISVLTVDFTLFGNINLGFTISCFAIFILTAVYLVNRRMNITPFTVFCMLATLLFAAVPAVYGSPGIKGLSLLAVVCLSALALCRMCALRKFSENSYMDIFNIPYLWFIRPMAGLGNTFRSVLASEDAGRGRNLPKILIGLGCAVPAVAVILPLLIRSDAAFEGFIANTIFDNLGRLLFSAIFGGVLFLFLFPAFFSLRKNDRDSETISVNTHRVDSAVLNAFLGAVSFIYILYIVSQFAYFFSAFSRILPKDYTFAEYARRGFFEMSILCAVNFVLVFLAVILVRTNDKGKLPIGLRITASFVSVFSMLLTVTAFSKMYLYIQNYGLTRLRVITCVFMAALFLTFAILLVRLFVRFPYNKVLVSCVSVLLLCVLFADVDTAVVKYNTWAYLSGRHSAIDLCTPEYRSDAAVPQLLSLLESDEEDVIQQAKKLLRYKYDEYRDAAADFRGYNYTREKAIRLLEKNHDRFMS